MSTLEGKALAAARQALIDTGVDFPQYREITEAIIACAIVRVATEAVERERAIILGIFAGCEGTCAVRDEPCKSCWDDSDAAGRIEQSIRSRVTK